MSIENVLGLDLETTGLDPVADGILEIGMEVVRPDFVADETFVVNVHQPEDVLARMKPEVHAQHKRSGLLDACARSTFDLGQCENLAMDFVEKRWPKGQAILLGFTIGFDRGFIKAQMPRLEKSLHYRMIDASSTREAIRIFGSKHRTLSDIDGAVSTVRGFIERLK